MGKIIYDYNPCPLYGVLRANTRIFFSKASGNKKTQFLSTPMKKIPIKKLNIQTHILLFLFTAVGEYIRNPDRSELIWVLVLQCFNTYTSVTEEDGRPEHRKG